MGRWLSTLAVRRVMARQRCCAAQFTANGFPNHPRFIGGMDMAFIPFAEPDIRTGSPGSRAVAVAVVWDLKLYRCVNSVQIRRVIRSPYVPGLLSFREAPLLCAAIKKLRHRVDVRMFDGHEISHPRGCGLATHMGISLGKPSIGAAKSLLCGQAKNPGHTPGSVGEIIFNNRLVGLAMRTQRDKEPQYGQSRHELHTSASC